MTILDVRTSNALGLGAAAAEKGAPNAGGGDLRARTGAVAAVAAGNADDVDSRCRFPEEAIAAARSQKLLGLLVPRELGGEGASLSEVVDVCYGLGKACSSTAMIYAMHQTKVACVVRHGRGSPWHERLLRRLADEQLLFASSTTEGQGGGNVRSSVAPVETDGSRIALERSATVISYGAQADAIVTTARRSPDAANTDQVLVAFCREDYTLEPLRGWDTLGMRGTCSAGFTMRAAGDVAQILPEGYDRIHAQTMTPVAHLAWSGVWAGIAAGAVERSRAFVRQAARGAGGQMPPGIAHFTKANSSLQLLRGLIASNLRRFEAIGQDERALAALDFQTAINLLKVDASELAVTTVLHALRACGLSGYRNDGDFSIGRSLRDVLSSPIMINNDRILASMSSASLMSGTPASLRD